MTNQNKIHLKVNQIVKRGDFFSDSNNFTESTISTLKKGSKTLFFNTCFDKNHLKTLIGWFLEQYGEKVTVDLVETLKQVGFQQATDAGVSLGLDDLKVPPQKKLFLSQASLKMNEVKNSLQRGNLTNVEKSQRLIETWNQTSENLRQTAVSNFRTTNPVNPVYMMAFSGARGNISQVRQLVAMRGLMADPQGAILEFPIQSNFREGLTLTEYLISCYGARKGLVDTALRTATSGYLTRRLVDAVQHVVIHIKDCQTKKGIVIKKKNLEQRLIGRVLFQQISLNSKTLLKKNTLISKTLAKHIASEFKEIIIRSPLTCQTEKSVCQLCYGLDLAHGKLVSIGEAVGIIAAQSIGEPGTQLTMRTFHTGGVGVFSDQAMKPFTAPFQGKVEFLEPLSGLFVRTLDGNIVYLVKHKTVNSEKTKPLLRLIPENKYENFSLNKTTNYEIYDIPSGSLLWVRQGESVKSGQLLVQASRLQTTIQKLPESIQPIGSPISGEVSFQSMAIQVVDQKVISKTSQFDKEQKSPTFPTLIKLGNFWIFSSFVQKETNFCNSFFKKGDLFSYQTPIQQYSLHFLKSGQLKKVNSSVVFGWSFLDFLISQIYYSKLFYVIKKYQYQNKDILLSYTSNSKSTLFTWYPVFQNNFDFVGYFSLFSFFNKVFDFKKFDNYENSKNINLQKTQISKYPQLSFLWFPHQVFKLNKNQINRINEINKSSPLIQTQLTETQCFLISQKVKPFSKSGIFQVQPSKQIHYTVKNNFNKNFVKNIHQNSLKTNFKPLSNRNGLINSISWNSNSRHTTFYELNQSDSSFTTINKGTNSNLLKSLNSLGFFNDSTYNGLNFSYKKLFYNLNYSIKVIEKKQSWVYISKIFFPNTFSSKFSGILLEPGKNFEDINFTNSFVSINLLHSKNIVFLKSKTNKSNFLFSVPNIKERKNQFKTDFSNFQIKEESVFFKKTNSNLQKKQDFYFYKQEQNGKIKIFKFKLKRKINLLHILVFQKASHQFLSTQQLFKQNSIFSKKPVFSDSFTSPLVTKQFKTSFKKNQNLKPHVKVFNPTHSGWFCFSSFVKIELKFNSLKDFGKTEQLKQNLVFLSPISKARKSKNQFPIKTEIKNLATLTNFQSVSQNTNSSNNPAENLYFPILKNQTKQFNQKKRFIVSSFSLFFYQSIKLQNSKQFEFFTFPNGWVFPEWKMSEAFLTSNKLGEFRGAQKKPKQINFSILRLQDRILVKFPTKHNKNSLNLLPKKVGTPVRWGEQIFNNFASPISGKIIKISLNRLTLQKGLPLLASMRGIVHITNNEFVEKNDLLITLRSRRLQTEDIVQGIPKIEQLFEARETQGGEILQNNLHALLKSFFIQARKLKPLSGAVELSLTAIQKFLVENILEAYSNQGVTIAEKHVEIVVRQMTARVRITNGGDSGFLPGELIQLRSIEKLNFNLEKLGRRQAQYEPIILGITKSVLQSESFLVAVSFQQVSKMLVRSAVAKKTDFLRGLHENILVGQPIPAGTGILELSSFEVVEKTQKSLNTKDFVNTQVSSETSSISAKQGNSDI